MEAKGQIILGDHSYICKEPNTRGALSNVIIGKFTSIAENVTFDCGFQHDYKAVTTFPLSKINPEAKSNVFSRGDIHIGNDVWIGENVTIMSGVTIRNGAVIGAGEVVRCTVPPYTILANGLLSDRFPHFIKERLLSIRWWDWPIEKIIENTELLQSRYILDFIHKHYKATNEQRNSK